MPNLKEVGPGVWRSAQPIGAEQWRAVSALGVRTVVKVNFDDEGDDSPGEALGIRVYHLGIEPAGDKDTWDNLLNTVKRPDGALILRAINILETAAGGGVLVHCTHGQDRTGLVVGMYRVLKLGWSRERAFKEMVGNGFHVELIGLMSTWTSFR